MSIEGQGHFFTIYFPGFVCFVLYWDKTSGDRLQDHWSSGIFMEACRLDLSPLRAYEKSLSHIIFQSWERSSFQYG